MDLNNIENFRGRRRPRHWRGRGRRYGRYWPSRWSRRYGYPNYWYDYPSTTAVVVSQPQVEPEPVASQQPQLPEIPSTWMTVSTIAVIVLVVFVIIQVALNFMKQRQTV